MPLIESQPGREHAEAWLYLSPREATELLAALQHGIGEYESDPEWHCHVTDAQGRELTVAIDPGLDEQA